MSTEKFSFFYGGPFSNWTTCSFTVDGVRYVSTEQFMMAEKARLFGDAETERRIMNTRDPEQAKILGRAVRGFNREVWDAKARDIVYKGCYAKFQQNRGFLSALTATKGTTIVEASKTDQIWGIGLSEYDPRAQNRATWRGTNWLGEVLTLVRDDMEAGIYRTENFCWNGAPPVENDVKLLDLTESKIWIWDHDKIRRWASDLKHDNKDIEGVAVVVREKADPKVFEIEIVCKRRNDEVKVAAEGGIALATGRAAIDLMKEWFAKQRTTVE